jgi:Arc/MetJ-type ribon-helix-helix transcriptional regulator
MKKYEIVLPPELEAFVDEQLAKGAWDSADMLFAYGVLLIQNEIEFDSPESVEWLRKEINKGIESANRGELVDADKVFDELEARLKPAPTEPT